MSNFCVAIARYSTQKYKFKVKNLISNTWTEINASKWVLTNTNFTRIAHFCRPSQRSRKFAYFHGKPAASKPRVPLHNILMYPQSDLFTQWCVPRAS